MWTFASQPSNTASTIIQLLLGGKQLVSSPGYYYDKSLVDGDYMSLISDVLESDFSEVIQVDFLNQ